VRFGSGQSWQLSTSDPFDVFFALYVRDAAGIVEAGGIPPLAPPVPRSSTAYSGRPQSALKEQWTAWWTALLTDRTDEVGRRGVDEPDFSSTVAAPELRAAQQAVLGPACEWRSANRFHARHLDRTAALMPTRLVEDIERETGREAPPFAYSLEVVPVDGVWSWDISENRALLSESLYADTAAFRQALRPRLAALF
jgi:hypothetical protein